MAFVSVPKDLTKVKNKIILNLTKRQLICLGIAAAVGLPFYFLARGLIGSSNAASPLVQKAMDDVEKYFARKQELTKRTEQAVGDKPIQKDNVSHPKSRKESVLQALRERQAKIKEQEQTVTKEKSRTHKKGEVSL